MCMHLAVLPRGKAICWSEVLRKEVEVLPACASRVRACTHNSKFMVSVADVLPFARPSASGFASGPKINDAVEKRGRLSWITPFSLGRATAAPWALSRKRFAHPFDKPPSLALSLQRTGQNSTTFYAGRRRFACIPERRNDRVLDLCQTLPSGERAHRPSHSTLMSGCGLSTWRQRSIISWMLPVAGLADHVEVAVTIVAEQQALVQRGEVPRHRSGCRGFELALSAVYGPRRGHPACAGPGR